MTHLSVSAGFGPEHCLSGSFAIVLENSRNILQCTSLFLMPSPHVTLQGLQSSAINLKNERVFSVWGFVLRTKQDADIPNVELML